MSDHPPVPSAGCPGDSLSIPIQAQALEEGPQGFLPGYHLVGSSSLKFDQQRVDEGGGGGG